jgi:putative oxidoreductase
MNDYTRYLPLIGRILIGVPFLMSGTQKIFAYAATTAKISGAGLPFAPLGWGIALVVEIGFGLLLIVGLRARPVAAVLAAWCLVTAIIFHTNFADPAMFAHFLFNMMIAGGLLQIAHFGAGALSFDARKSGYHAEAGMIAS